MKFSVLAALLLLLASCSQSPEGGARIVRAADAPKLAAPPPEPFYIPDKHGAFTCLPCYPRTLAVWKNEARLQAKGPRRVVVDLAMQRGMFYVNGEVAMDFPVCTGTSGKPTPRGTFNITEKKVKHRSNLYHCSMPYFMRLTNDGIGLHVGEVLRRPASHGCVRLTREACIPLFKNAPHGTPVEIR